MSEEAVLFILRLAAGGLLLSFGAAVGLMMWRDYRQTAEVMAARPRQSGGRLVLLKSSQKALPEGQSWPLQPVTTLGRAPGNTIVLNEPFASNKHALVAWRDGQWWLEDLQSSNGTMLNGTLIEEATVLSSGDIIGFGHIQLQLQLE